MKNKIEKLNCNFEILELNDDDGLVINSKTKKEKITIYDQNLIENMIEKTFNKKYRNLLYLIMNLMESEDSTETDFELALLKIENFRNKLLEKYFKFLNTDMKNKYLKMIILLQDKLVIPEKKRGR